MIEDEDEEDDDGPEIVHPDMDQEINFLQVCNQARIQGG